MCLYVLVLLVPFSTTPEKLPASNTSAEWKYTVSWFPLGGLLIQGACDWGAVCTVQHRTVIPGQQRQFTRFQHSQMLNPRDFNLVFVFYYLEGLPCAERRRCYLRLSPLESSTSDSPASRRTTAGSAAIASKLASETSGRFGWVARLVLGFGPSTQRKEQRVVSTCFPMHRGWGI